MTGLPWATMVSGLRLGGRALLAPMARLPSPELRRIAEAGRAQVDSAADDLGRLGDRFQGTVVDLVFDVAEGEPSLRRWLRSGMLVMSDSARAAAAALPSATGVPWLELHNKVEAFRRLDGAEAALALPTAGPVDVTAALHRAAGLGPFAALWTAEGLGHLLTDRAVEEVADVDPRGLLARDQLPQLPGWSRVPLHAGLGLAFADRVLAAGGEIRGSLERFLDLCRTNSRDGWADVAFEALGFVARVFHDQRTAGIDRELRRIDPLLADYFWHGVGRGLYFAPAQALPVGISWRWAFERCRREAPDERARKNALAGYVWALALVNITHPQVLSEFLRQAGAASDDGDAIAGGAIAGGAIAGGAIAGGAIAGGAIAHGAASAVLVWRSAAGRDAILEGFLAHRPASGDGAERWHRWVRQPSEAALGGPYEALVDSRRLGALFRYRPVAELEQTAREALPPSLAAAEPR